jgi:protein-L-isoaspartate(D-aspartate) O-methyltransferase
LPKQLLLEEERKSLVDSLRYKGISDERVLQAFVKVQREKFIAEPLRKYAYEDNALPIACMQTISQPFTVAYMTMVLDVHPKAKTLEVGTGSGYQTAILCEMGAEVYSIERIPDLFESAMKLLRQLGYHATLKCGDGTMGWKEHAPFDRILVTAGSPGVPPALIEQLSDDGKLVIPVGTLDNQKLYEISKTKEGLDYRLYESFKFVPLIGKGGWKSQ